MSDPLDFRILTEEDSDEVWKIIMETYAPGEPTLTIAKFSKEDLHVLLGNPVQKAIRHRVSVGAFDQCKNKLVAVRLSWLGKLHHKEDKPEKLCHKLPIHIRQQNEAMDFVLGKNISETLGTIQYMRCFLLCTRPEYRRRGIATELYRRSIEIARREGCKKILTVASSEYTLKITRKLGFVPERTVYFKDYVDSVTGEKIYENLPDPHNKMTLEVLHL